jgi:hypothetical protein
LNLRTELDERRTEINDLISTLHSVRVDSEDTKQKLTAALTENEALVKQLLGNKQRSADDLNRENECEDR